jgi:hypothetical protein
MAGFASCLAIYSISVVGRVAKGEVYKTNRAFIKQKDLHYAGCSHSVKCRRACVYRLPSLKISWSPGISNINVRKPIN